MTSQNRQIVLDTETTGLSTSLGHKIIEIGCVEILNREVTQNNFHYYINPEKKIDEKAFEVHGIKNEFLTDKPLFKDIVKPVLEYIKDSEVIIHNAKFDVEFLNYELSFINKDLKIENICKITDSLNLAKSLYSGSKNNLNALCKRLNIDNSNRDLHGALLDAQLLAEVYLRMTISQTDLILDDDEKTFVQDIDEELKLAQGLPIIMANNQELNSHNEFVKKFL